MVRDSETVIESLDRDLSRLRRRATRQRRDIRSNPASWQRWSATMDEVSVLTQRLIASSAPDIASIAAKFRAIRWLIEVNESVLDADDLRRLRRFGRDLDLLADK